MTDEPKNDPQDEPETAAREPEPAPDEPAAEATAPEPEEVTAEPVEPGEAEQGPTVDMPPPGESSEHAAPGTTNMAIYGWAAACHLLGLADFTFSFVGIGILAPLILWLALKDKDPEVGHAGKEAVNFQLNLLFWHFISWIFVVCLIGIPMLIALSVLEVVLVVIATYETFNGQRYRYPWILRVIE